nr:MAG TPA: hypothetical protein [Bacteriophage sp.]
MATTLKGAEQKTLQDALLDAIDYMTTAKMDKLTLDKTVVATIVKSEDLIKNTYKIRYQGNDNLIAKAQSGDTYKKGQQVYVLVPQNDLSNDKIILGTASVDNASSEAGFISSVMNDYTYSGENAFLSSPRVFGLRSVHTAGNQDKKDSELVYGSAEFLEQAGDQTNPYTINTRFAQSAKNSEKIMLKAEFRTSLPSWHRMPNCGGEYGLKAVLSFNTNDVYYYVLDDEGKEKTTKDDGTLYIASDEGVKVGHKKRYQLYTLESSSPAFTGQPFNYPSFTEQYAIFDFDAKNFNAVESVVVYCKGFPQKTPETEAENIFVRNIQIYGLSRITAVQGDYSLRLNPATLVFSKSSDGKEDREVSTRADFRKKSLSLSSDIRMKFVWGAEDKTITSVSEGYNGYLGSGWKEIKSIGNTAYFSTKENDNLAYENRYKCSAIYSGDDDTKVILVQEFVVYNINAKRDIEITSNLGNEFAFDNGTPTLTCSVKDDKGASFLTDTDYEYIFVWSITTEDGSSRQIYSEQEAQKKVDDIKASLSQGGSPVKYADYAQAKNDRALASGVKYGTDENGNEARYILTLPISSVASSATVYCTVYRKPKGDGESHNIGTASITLKNSKSVEVARYHIVIENGTQSFQYSEIGISPCDEEYNGLDNQEILPLTCHFFDPQGLEVPASEYVIQWSVPTSDSFFTTEGLNLSYKNPADDTGEQVSNSQVLSFKIQSRWRYAYTNRQITAIVTYQGEEFRKDTEFLFAKIGDNGTNGTDYVVKIVPKDDKFYPLPNSKGDEKYYENSYLPAFYLYAGTTPTGENENVFTNDTAFYFPTLIAKLYQRGVEVKNYKEFNWSIAKSGERYNIAPLQISSGTLSKIGYDGTSSLPKEGNYYKGQIIKVSAKVNSSTDEDNKPCWDTIYGFYPMPIIKSYGCVISLNKTYTMQQVLYNSDGKFPQYDTDQGFKIDNIFSCDENGTTFTRVDETGYTVTASCYGGRLENASTSDLVSCDVPDEKQDDVPPLFRRYVVTPRETYSGQYQNNGIYLAIKDENQKLVCEAWIPVYMSLNRYSLASLNKWDGNSIEIKDDEGKRSYILAPQIGAGIKGEDNSFTGVVMGSRFEQREDAEGKVKEQNDVGLFGYSEGEQSIFLDAKTGKAVFGLPKDSGRDGGYEGRIILTPGGESTIANLTLASNTIYGASKLNSLDWEVGGEDEDNKTPYPKYWPKKSNWVTKVKQELNDTGKGYNYPVEYSTNYLDNFKYDRKLGSPYKDYPVAGAQFGIPPEAQGILLSSTPPYFSAKGHPLNKYNSDIDWDNGMRQLDENDSLEVEIDPNKTSIFSIYRHYKELDDEGKIKLIDGKPVYKRYPMVGIDANGSFYTNSVKQENTTMTINRVGAFGLTASQYSLKGSPTYPNYTGANFSFSGQTIIKIFEPTNKAWSDLEENKKDSNYTYITTGTNNKTEYDKGLRFNNKSFESYVTEAQFTGRTTPHKLILKQNENFFGTEKDTFLNMIHDGSSSTIELQKRIYDEKDEKKFNSYGLNVSVDEADGSTSLLNGPKQFLNFTSAEGKTTLKAGNSLLNLTLTDEKSFLKIEPDSTILQIQKTEGKTTETSNLVLNHDSFTAKISSKGEFLKIDKDSSRFSHKYKDGSKSYESYLLLNTDDGITMETPSNLLAHAGEKAYFYTTGYKSGQEEANTRNYIKMEGDDFELHSQRGGILSLYSGFKVIVNKEEKTLNLTSSTLSNNLTILGDNTSTKENKGLYFTSAPNGLLIERYQEQRGNETWDSNMYVLKRNSLDDKDHALRVKGNMLVDEALKAKKSISSDYFSGRIIDITGDSCHICFLNPDDPEDFSATIDREWFGKVQRRAIDTDHVTSISKKGNTISWSTLDKNGGSFNLPESKTYTLQKAELDACPTPDSVSSFSEVNGALKGLVWYCNSLRGAYYSLNLA